MGIIPAGQHPSQGRSARGASVRLSPLERRSLKQAGANQVQEVGNGRRSSVPVKAQNDPAEGLRVLADGGLVAHAAVLSAGMRCEEKIDQRSPALASDYAAPLR